MWTYSDTKGERKGLFCSGQKCTKLHIFSVKLGNLCGEYPQPESGYRLQDPLPKANPTIFTLKPPGLPLNIMQCYIAFDFK